MKLNANRYKYIYIKVVKYTTICNNSIDKENSLKLGTETSQSRHRKRGGGL